jgi:energy-coupling factor transporter transmembrane protein EcfT
MCCLRYVCLFAYNGVQHILCCVFVLFFFVLRTLCCQFLWIVLFWIAPSVFSNVYFLYKHFNHVSLNYKEKYDYDL